MFYDENVFKLRETLFNTQQKSTINEEFFKKIINSLKENDNILDIGTGNGYVLKKNKKKI